MRLFARLSDLLSANVNALLDRVENPEVMLAQIVREMEEGLACARSHAATAIAAERRLGRELELNRTEAATWRTKARDALASGREDLARLGLARKHEHDLLVRSLETQYADALTTSTSVRASLRALEARLTEARRKQRTLVARQRAARARLELCRLGGNGIPDPGSPAAKFERLENRLTDLEDDLAARFEVNGVLDVAVDEFVDRETSHVIDRELEELKRELS